TMIYVTHDQTEALTFADHVVVMRLGEVVQVGSPVDLFERPHHTFVGHFIGSPGMNVLPATLDSGRVTYAGHPIESWNAAAAQKANGTLEIGVRPEFVRFAESGVLVDVVKVADAGRFRIVEARHRDDVIKVIVPESEAVPSAGQAHLRFDPDRTQIYANGWLAE
ncbi:MAG: ABC transporter ATP-binding protein, partial [Pseudomonadota bacterium]